MTDALAETLAMVAAAAAMAKDDWWIIGSAAVALHGSEAGPIRDVDLLMSAPDAEALLRRVGETPGRGVPNERFSSEVFGTWTEPPIPLEVMGGLRVSDGGKWSEVALTTREKVTVGGGHLFVASASELAELLESFGRPKDLERARLLRGSVHRK